MTQGERQKLREAMAVCSEASRKASRRGTDFNSQQALIYATVSMTMWWVMAVLGEEPQGNPIYEQFERVLANAKEFGCGLSILPDGFRG